MVTEAEGFLLCCVADRVSDAHSQLLPLRRLDAGAAAQDQVFIWRLSKYLETSKNVEIK